MFIQNSIKFVECNVKMIHSTVCPEVTPLILDTFEDCIFIEKLIRSKLNTREKIYGFFFNQSNVFGLIELTERNVSDFFTHVFNTYLLTKGYRYFYCPDLFPVTNITIWDGDKFNRLLDWSIEVVDNFYDAPEYIETFSPFVEAYKLLRKEDMLSRLIGDAEGISNWRIDSEKLSVKMEDYCYDFEVPMVGNFIENINSLNISLYRANRFYFSYVMNITDCTLELWVSY